MTEKGSNTVWHEATVTRVRRERLLGHRSVVLWFTGLSGAGKSTLAHALEEALFQRGCHTLVLDGDNVRHGLCADLGFSLEDRSENIRRIGQVAQLVVEARVIVTTAFISPLRSDRNLARDLFPHGDFVEVYCEAALDVCEQRDTKGLYQRARAGEVKEFTGISSPYEPPGNPELVVKTGELPLRECVDQVIAFLGQRGILVDERAPGP